jgi:hypothetical protein
VCQCFFNFEEEGMEMLSKEIKYGWIMGLCVGLVLALTGGAQALMLGPELLTNGDFGTGDFTGWTVGGTGSSVLWNDVTDVPLGPDRGSEPAEEFIKTAGYAAKVNGARSISQGIATSAGQVYRLAFFYDSSTTAYLFKADVVIVGQGEYEIYNLAGVTKVAGMPVTHSTDGAHFMSGRTEAYPSWVKQVYLITVPNVAHNSELIIMPAAGGTPGVHSVWYDDVSLRQVIPEPSTVGLFCTGLLGLCGIARRMVRR